MTFKTKQTELFWFVQTSEGWPSLSLAGLGLYEEMIAQHQEKWQWLLVFQGFADNHFCICQNPAFWRYGSFQASRQLVNGFDSCIEVKQWFSRLVSFFETFWWSKSTSQHEACQARQAAKRSCSWKGTVCQHPLDEGMTGIHLFLPQLACPIGGRDTSFVALLFGLYHLFLLRSLPQNLLNMKVIEVFWRGTRAFTILRTGTFFPIGPTP